MTGEPEVESANVNSLSCWLRQSSRSAVFLRPDLERLRASPLILLALTALLVGWGVLLQRIGLPGPALFYWQAVASGWLATVLLLWACWLVARSRPDAANTATFFGVLLAQQLLISVLVWALYLLLPRLGGLPPLAIAWVQWGLAYAGVGWAAIAAAVLLLRHTARGGLRLAVLSTVLLAGTVNLIVPPTQFWYPDASAADAEAEWNKRPRFTQESIERQSRALATSLNALQPQRPGVIDVYAITFAPYAREDVFRRESAMVADVMGTRFDAQGRTLQLVNHAETLGETPWATGLNLQRAIQRAASLMDVNEDVLFIHLTSHGAKDGQLSADFYPLEVERITPSQLRAWLDEAKVRHRVISVSACYSGSWLPVLAEPGSLVMTAADAEHTSYGCGRGSELTYFGRAMYNEQLRNSTHSFEVAHAAARLLIEQREKEAGKTDGYSNPQIAMGEAVRPALAALAARLDAAGK